MTAMNVVAMAIGRLLVAIDQDSGLGGDGKITWEEFSDYLQENVRPAVDNTVLLSRVAESVSVLTVCDSCLW